jgi:hypothetical protein
MSNKPEIERGYLRDFVEPLQNGIMAPHALGYSGRWLNYFAVLLRTEAGSGLDSVEKPTPRGRKEDGQKRASGFC